MNNWINNNSNKSIPEKVDKIPEILESKINKEKITKLETKQKVLKLIEKAENLTPEKMEKDLPNMKDHPDVRKAHFYENEIWRIGEEIRVLILEHKGLRKDDFINDKIINFCLNRNSKCGRESFIMLLWYKHNQKYAGKLASLIDDKYVYGHIIEGLNKLQVEGYCEKVSKFTNDKRTWVKKQAIKYVEKYCTQQHI
tara:strand:+ start:80 stop:670 length:591 start_codon:yes stop_codon:yes gene_type:complete